MPMIDIYAKEGTFADPKKLAQDAADAVKTIEQVPDIPMFRKNTAAFVHELKPMSISNVDGDDNYVRVQVLTNAGALDRTRQVAVVRQLTDLVASAAGDPGLKDRTWVMLTEAARAAGLWGHVHTTRNCDGRAESDGQTGQIIDRRPVLEPAICPQATANSSR